MGSAHPKVLHEIAGVPMIRHVLDALRPLEPAETVVVLGSGMAAVARAVAPAATAIQEPPRGTGDAVRAARPILAQRFAENGVTDLVVLYGDTPLLTTETIAALLEARGDAAVAVAGFRPLAMERQRRIGRGFEPGAFAGKVTPAPVRILARAQELQTRFEIQSH